MSCAKFTSQHVATCCPIFGVKWILLRLKKKEAQFPIQQTLFNISLLDLFLENAGFRPSFSFPEDQKGKHRRKGICRDYSMLFLYAGEQWLQNACYEREGYPASLELCGDLARQGSYFSLASRPRKWQSEGLNLLWDSAPLHWEAICPMGARDTEMNSLGPYLPRVTISCGLQSKLSYDK